MNVTLATRYGSVERTVPLEVGKAFEAGQTAVYPERGAEEALGEYVQRRDLLTAQLRQLLDEMEAFENDMPYESDKSVWVTPGQW